MLARCTRANGQTISVRHFVGMGRVPDAIPALVCCPVSFRDSLLAIVGCSALRVVPSIRERAEVMVHVYCLVFALCSGLYVHVVGTFTPDVLSKQFKVFLLVGGCCEPIPILPVHSTHSMEPHRVQ